SFSPDTLLSSIFTLSLHDALPILHFYGAHLAVLRVKIALYSLAVSASFILPVRADLTIVYASTLRPTSQAQKDQAAEVTGGGTKDRKSTRLNSSHVAISYAVFCLK